MELQGTKWRVTVTIIDVFKQIEISRWFSAQAPPTRRPLTAALLVLCSLLSHALPAVSLSDQTLPATWVSPVSPIAH